MAHALEAVEYLAEAGAVEDQQPALPGQGALAVHRLRAVQPASIQAGLLVAGEGEALAGAAALYLDPAAADRDPFGVATGVDGEGGAEDASAQAGAFHHEGAVGVMAHVEPGAAAQQADTSFASAEMQVQGAVGIQQHLATVVQGQPQLVAGGAGMVGGIALQHTGVAPEQRTYCQAEDAGSGKGGPAQPLRGGVAPMPAVAGQAARRFAELLPEQFDGMEGLDIGRVAVQPAAEGDALARRQLRILQAYVPASRRFLAIPSGLLFGRGLHSACIPRIGRVAITTCGMGSVLNALAVLEDADDVLFHGAQGNPEPLGDARIGQPVDATEQERLLAAAGQAAQPAQQVLQLLAGLGLLLQIDRFLVFRLLLGMAAAYPARAQMVQGQVLRGAEQQAAIAVAELAVPQAQEGVLGQVLRCAAIADDAPDQLQQPVLLAQVEGQEGRRLAHGADAAG
ncbi:hypothetical protein D3C84_406780 [compost metagenome]